MSKEIAVACESDIYFGELLLISVLSCLYRLSSIDFKGILIVEFGIVFLVKIVSGKINPNNGRPISFNILTVG